MPRKPRCYVAGLPCHVITRGNNRQACFFTDSDYHLYLECLSDACDRYKVALHAYVLMTNHVHLLMTPETCDGISRVMQSIGRRYVQHVNHKYRRTGTLWEGRHKASLIQAENYLLACYGYIELNPVRASMVKHPSDYKWSSYLENAGLAQRLITAPHSLYDSLAVKNEDRTACYRLLVDGSLDPEVLKAIRKGSESSLPTGDSRFKQEIEDALKRSIDYSQ